MIRLPRLWRCVLGHRWEYVDGHMYELGRGYETTLIYERCARCGQTREHHDGAHDSFPSTRPGTEPRRGGRG